MKKLYHLLASFAFCATIPLAHAQQEAPPNFEFNCGGAFAPTPPPFDPPESFLPICPDPSSVKYIRVAIHFLLPGQIVSLNGLQSCVPPYTGFNYIGAGNFTEYGDGFHDKTYNGFLRANDIINKANEELANNNTQWRKDPNSYYPPDTPANVISYVLVGTYFHRDPVAYYLKEPNDLSYSETEIATDAHDQYDVGGIEVMDVYLTPHGSWSGNAFAIGGADKFIFNNDYWTYIACEGWSTQYSAQLLQSRSRAYFVAYTHME